jgi:hypothetical protein
MAVYLSPSPRATILFPTSLPLAASSPPDTFSPLPSGQKMEVFPVPTTGSNQVGAACSAFLLQVYHTLTARKPARSRLSLRLFPSPQKVSASNRGVWVEPIESECELRACQPSQSSSLRSEKNFSLRSEGAICWVSNCCKRICRCGPCKLISSSRRP